MKNTAEFNIQEVFNKVIEKGYYNEEDEFMCNSLAKAGIDGVISEEEFVVASDSVQDYLEELGLWTGDTRITLEDGLSAISNYQEKWLFHERLAIYLDWENRPQPWKEGNK